jgi:hypothetical protein
MPSLGSDDITSIRFRRIAPQTSLPRREYSDLTLPLEDEYPAYAILAVAFSTAVGKEHHERFGTNSGRDQIAPHPYGAAGLRAERRTYRDVRRRGYGAAGLSARRRAVATKSRQAKRSD